MAHEETSSGSEDACALIRRAAHSLPPPAVVRYLLSIAVCVRCIFRMFGIREPAYYSSCFMPLMFLSSLEEAHKCSDDDTPPERSLSSNGLDRCSNSLPDLGSGCRVCLGILQFSYFSDEDTTIKNNSVDGFAAKIAEIVKKEAHEIDGFLVEVKVPPIILANESGLRQHLQKQYDSEEWLNNKFLSISKQISLKEALRSSITPPLENLLGVKSGANSFYISLSYMHLEASEMADTILHKGHSSKRRRTELKNGKELVIGFRENNHRDFSGSIQCNSDAVSASVMVSCACRLIVTPYRQPVYISGRYLKFSRKVSQSRWIVDDERMGVASVEEIVGNSSVIACRGDSYKFHAAGREDIDVRMLGSGRPYLVEISNARHIPSLGNIQEIAEKINNSDEKYVEVRNIKMVGSEVWSLMREGEAEKQKQYAALVWLSRQLSEADLQNVSSIKNMEITQATPVRVLHRRSPMDRKKIIHWISFEKVAGSCQYFLLHLCTQAGTYIKEFVHGDLGRTHPSLGSLLGCRAEILQLDVTDVKMDCFD